MINANKLYSQRKWLFFVGIKALIENKNKVLLLSSGKQELSSTKRRRIFWDLPGGKVEWGEGILDALQREVKEELGIDNGQLRVIRIFEASVSRIKISHGIEVPLILVTFLCKLKNPNNSFKLTGEHSSYLWANMRTAKKLLKTKFNSTFIQKLSALEKV
jgi:8-oxo-dGTP pyrophosphatase MutT (NUDIX family)